MEKIRKLLLSSLCLLSLLPATGCKDKIVINNAFVYLVHESCDKYGTIKTTSDHGQWQTVFTGEYSYEVEAIPNDGYIFIEWSDGLKDAKRSDLAVEDNNQGPVVYYAFFGEVDG